jgi:hypothetical protein
VAKPGRSRSRRCQRPGRVGELCKSATISRPRVGSRTPQWPSPGVLSLMDPESIARAHRRQNGTQRVRPPGSRRWALSRKRRAARRWDGTGKIAPWRQAQDLARDGTQAKEKARSRHRWNPAEFVRRTESSHPAGRPPGSGSSQAVGGRPGADRLRRSGACRERIVSGGRGPVGSGSPQAVGGLTKSGSPDLPRDTAQRRIATLRAAKEMASPGSGPAPGTSCRRSAGPVSRFPTSHAERDSGPGRGRRGHVPRGVSGRFPTELRGSASPANQGEPHGGFSPQPPKRKKGRPA